ncbi:ABC transporter ATP-binding protein [Lactobacillus xylocopicola]|uniref:ABC transporter ATP-binding protein n=1 Tax=Lactobacillus xylocopicola TaxID=2976676 RepID=A0ABM8BEU0_9LACO|nr:ATP-binding cassette domain-containing protein [Lactobacillus xylocopicola]BDR59756.1 ABC transporter ATP-binding protein [Lactobacillus xylocopicola]
MINIKVISYSYKTFEKNSGLHGTIKDFFHREKVYVSALKKVNLNIKDGEVVGLIGPNGAGKTTLVKVLTGILSPTNGQVVIDGIFPDSHDKKMLANIGVLFGQKSQLSWDLPPIDTLNMLGSIYNIDVNDFDARLSELSNMLNAKDILRTPTRNLSLGQRVKCDLICSLIHNPKYLFLDEPTLGLDLVTQESIYNFLRKLNQVNGTTIIITSHNMRDIEAVTKRLLILAKGKIIFDGSIKSLPVNVNEYKKFCVRLYDGKKEQIEENISADNLSKTLKSIDPKQIISISREGVSVEELILKIYKNQEF